jgi:alkaline phosphatase D
LAALLATARAAGQGEPVRRIAFGAGASQERPQPIWDAVVAGQPDLFLFLGDAVYGDTENVEILKAKYAQLAAVPGYQKLLQTCPVYATWDGHDYGAEAGGADYAQKAASQKVFLDFFKDAADSLRRKRPGVYGAWVFGPPGKRVQIILLDTRYFRSPLRTTPGARGYAPNTDPDAMVLGPDQWQWLEAQLRNPAEVRLLASPIPVVAEDQPGEKWANFPRERERLFQAVRSARAEGLIILSGHRNLGELSQMDAGLGYPLFDLTSSGLNMAAKRWRPAEANRHRVAVMTSGDNFGQVQIDWDAPEPQISLQVRDERGDATIRQKLPLGLLRVGTLKSSPAVASAGPKAEASPGGGAMTAAEAAKHVGEKVTVEMAVRNAGGTRDKKTVFLNSSADFRSKDNFTVVLRAPEAFKAKGIDDPGAYFKGKTVRVTGTVALFREAPQIVVEDVGQISVVE